MTWRVSWACGSEEQELGFGRHAFARFIALQQLTNRFAQIGPTRLPGLYHVVAKRLEALSQGAYLCRFAAAFAAFEADKKSGHVFRS